MLDRYKEIFAELRNITTIDLAYKTSNFLEKLFWTFIGISGTVWAIYFITFQVRLFHISKFFLAGKNLNQIDNDIETIGGTSVLNLT